MPVGYFMLLCSLGHSLKHYVIPALSFVMLFAVERFMFCSFSEHQHNSTDGCSVIITKIALAKIRPINLFPLDFNPFLFIIRANFLCLQLFTDDKVYKSHSMLCIESNESKIVA